MTWNDDRPYRRSLYRRIVPDHPHGFTWPTIRSILNDSQLRQFEVYMDGQTQGLGDMGEGVVYEEDLRRFLRGVTL